MLEEALKAFPGTFEILFQKRFWPHKEEAGGFFVARIRKTASLQETERSQEKALRKSAYNEDLAVCSPTEERMVRASLTSLGADNLLEENRYVFFKYKSDILAVRNFPGIKEIAKSRYFIRFGERIGRLESHGLEPNWILGKNRVLSGVARYELPDEVVLDRYLKGAEVVMSAGISELQEGFSEVPGAQEVLSNEHREALAREKVASESSMRTYAPGTSESSNASDAARTSESSSNSAFSGPIQLFFRGRPIGLEYAKNGLVSNRFPKEWRRR